MRLIATRKSLERILRWTQRILFTGAALSLAYCGAAIVDAWNFQRLSSQELERHVSGFHASPPRAIAPEGLIGRIAIPRLGLSATVAEGTEWITLQRAVGHIPNTGMPGKPGNVGLAGHRDTFFRSLKDVREHDVITLTTFGGEYRYRVVSTRVVSPTEVSVLDPGEDQALTLVTCYPFSFVGAAPDRFVVRAERIT